MEHRTRSHWRDADLIVFVVELKAGHILDLGTSKPGWEWAVSLFCPLRQRWQLKMAEISSYCMARLVESTVGLKQWFRNLRRLLCTSKASSALFVASEVHNLRIPEQPRNINRWNWSHCGWWASQPIPHLVSCVSVFLEKLDIGIFLMKSLNF